MSLVAIRCPACGLTAYPVADRCPRCTARDVGPVELAATGVVETLTTGGTTGYLAEVRTDDGVLVLGRLRPGDDDREPEVGDRVIHAPGDVVEFTRVGP
jgi:uncharacterized OB-fold protein